MSEIEIVNKVGFQATLAEIRNNRSDDCVAIYSALVRLCSAGKDLRSFGVCHNELIDMFFSTPHGKSSALENAILDHLVSVNYTMTG